MSSCWPRRRGTISASFQRIQADVTSLAARELLQALAGTAPTTPVGRAALQRPARLGRAMRADAPEPLIYQAWMRRLKQRIFDDDLGSLAPDLVEPVPLTGAMLGVLTGQARARRWCDEVGTPERHQDCLTLAAESLDQAAGELAREPRDLDPLRWGQPAPGRVRTSTVLQCAAAARLVRTTRRRSRGDGDTVTWGCCACAVSGRSRHAAGASCRMIYGPCGRRYRCLDVRTGQSGNPFSPQFGDLLEPWAQGAISPDRAPGQPGADADSEALCPMRPRPVASDPDSTRSRRSTAARPAAAFSQVRSDGG